MVDHGSGDAIRCLPGTGIAAAAATVPDGWKVVDRASDGSFIIENEKCQDGCPFAKLPRHTSIRSVEASPDSIRFEVDLPMHWITKALVELHAAGQDPIHVAPGAASDHCEDSAA